MASAKAIAKIMFVCILEVASGFLLIPFNADAPINPTAIAGAITPTPIVMAVANKRITSTSIITKFKNQKLKCKIKACAVRAILNFEL